MAPWVSEFVLGRVFSRHSFNTGSRLNAKLTGDKRAFFKVSVYMLPKIKGDTPLYSDIDAEMPLGATVNYKLRVFPKPGLKLDTSAWSFRNDKPQQSQTKP